MTSDREEQEDELLALHSIFDSEEFVRNESKCAGEIRVSVELPANFTVVLKEGETLRQYEISFLPPLHLTFELPENYPSSSPPSFTLTCSWLTHIQVSALAAQLDDLYQATGGAAVLFSWVQFLREDALRVLDIHSLLELPSDKHTSHLSDALSEPKKNLHSQNSLTSYQSKISQNKPADYHNEDKSDKTGQDDVSKGKVEGAASLPVNPFGGGLTPSQTLLSQILIYDADQKQKVFASTVFDCGVCYMSSLGSDCVQLSECGHVFCQACLSRFCEVQIKEGNVLGVTCPQADCTAAPTPAQVRKLVGEEMFNRYDRLLLQSTLDAMSDVVYCPRRSCGSAVVREKSSSAAMCSVCSFAFCVTCRKTYHGPDDCTKQKQQTDEDVEDNFVKLPRTYDGLKALIDDYKSGSKDRKRFLERRYGRRIRHVRRDEFLTEEWLTNNSKSCPHCFSKIEKNGGCNRMTCSQCRQYFCWVCLSRLSSHGEHTDLSSDSPCRY